LVVHQLKKGIDLCHTSHPLVNNPMSRHTFFIQANLCERTALIVRGCMRVELAEPLSD
jgi:hypothetical protein